MSTGAMDSGWYYSKLGGPPGQQVGPISWEDLVSYSRAGTLTPNDLVWNEQLGDWRPAAQIPGLFSAPAPAAAPAGYAAPAAYGAAAPAKSRLLYWLIPLIVLLLTVTTACPKLANSAPPLPALLSARVLLVIVTGPSLKIAPPL